MIIPQITQQSRRLRWSDSKGLREGLLFNVTRYSGMHTCKLKQNEKKHNMNANKTKSSSQNMQKLLIICVN